MRLRQPVERFPGEAALGKMAVAQTGFHNRGISDLGAHARERAVRRVAVARRSILGKEPPLPRRCIGLLGQEHDLAHAVGQPAHRFEPQADEVEELRDVERRRRRLHRLDVVAQPLEAQADLDA